MPARSRCAVCWTYRFVFRKAVLCEGRAAPLTFCAVGIVSEYGWMDGRGSLITGSWRVGIEGGTDPQCSLDQWALVAYDMGREGKGREGKGRERRRI